MGIEDPAVNWLLDTGDPSIRYLTLAKVLGRPSDSYAWSRVSLETGSHDLQSFL